VTSAGGSATPGRSPVDAHQHLWDPADGGHGWLDRPEHAAIRRRFGVEDLQAVLPAEIAATVLVQALASVTETETLLAVAAAPGPVAGVVGWGGPHRARRRRRAGAARRAPRWGAVGRCPAARPGRARPRLAGSAGRSTGTGCGAAPGAGGGPPRPRAATTGGAGRGARRARRGLGARPRGQARNRGRRVGAVGGLAQRTGSRAQRELQTVGAAHRGPPRTRRRDRAPAVGRARAGPVRAEPGALRLGLAGVRARGRLPRRCGRRRGSCSSRSRRRNAPRVLGGTAQRVYGLGARAG